VIEEDEKRDAEQTLVEKNAKQLRDNQSCFKRKRQDKDGKNLNVNKNTKSKMKGDDVYKEDPGRFPPLRTRVEITGTSSSNLIGFKAIAVITSYRVQKKGQYVLVKFESCTTVGNFESAHWGGADQAGEGQASRAES